MLTKMEKSAFVIVALIVAMLACGPHPVSASQNGAGIWVYNDDWSIALVNLTDHALNYLRESKTNYDAHPYPITMGSGTCLTMLAAGSDWHVEPYRTKVWGANAGSWLIPCHYDGRMTLYSDGFRNWSFDLVFEEQKASGLAEHGTWIGLSPHEPWQEWETNYNGWAYGRWVTPVDDYAMHNVMTLIGPEVMVTLYSTDLDRLIVVVQQLQGTDPFTGALLWDDSNVYRGLALDFVDNGGRSVPGQ